MSPAQHTKGPWTYSRMGTVGNFRVTGPVFLSGEEETPMITGIAFNIFHEANARLIAAAPELLAALESLLDSCELNLDEIDVVTMDKVLAARTAIGKAKGGKP